jgi:hypothetical protein
MSFYGLHASYLFVCNVLESVPCLCLLLLWWRCFFPVCCHVLILKIVPLPFWTALCGVVCKQCCGFSQGSSPKILVPFLSFCGDVKKPYRLTLWWFMSTGNLFFRTYNLTKKFAIIWITTSESGAVRFAKSNPDIKRRNPQHCFVKLVTQLHLEYCLRIATCNLYGFLVSSAVRRRLL